MGKVNDAYDTIVIGAGHNGLVTAAYLARAGQRVLVLERSERVGGAVATEDVFPGFKFDTGSHRIERFHPSVVLDLRLAAHGLEIVASDPSVFAPTPEGHHLLLWRKAESSIESIGKLSAKDAERWKAFCGLVAKAAAFLESIYDNPPPDPLSNSRGDLWQLFRLGRRLRGLGKRDMLEVLRILPMTAKELLDEWFETDVLKGCLGSQGISGVLQGPMAAGTAYLFLHHQVGRKDGALRSTARVRGGMGNLARALAEAARQAGAEIRTKAPVGRILVKDGRAFGVALNDGGEIKAGRVVSNADPRHTFLELLDSTALSPEFLRAVRNIRFKGVCARVNLALKELPNFSCLPGEGPHLQGAITIAPSLEYLERAYDDAKYGEPSQEPYLEAVIPSLNDPDLAPAGRHVMSIFVQYAPYQLKDGAWDSIKREALGDRVVQTLAQYAPNLESAILHRQVLSPLDLENAFALTEGNIYHGEMTLDQLLFMRPVAGCSRYKTPLAGLYLCGAGTHPGGGVNGASGYNAARQILQEKRNN